MAVLAVYVSLSKIESQIFSYHIMKLIVDIFKTLFMLIMTLKL